MFIDPFIFDYKWSTLIIWVSIPVLTAIGLCGWAIYIDATSKPIKYKLITPTETIITEPGGVDINADVEYQKGDTTIYVVKGKIYKSVRIQ